MDILLFLRVRERQAHPQRARTPWLRTIGRPFVDRGFRRYLVHTFLIAFSTGYVAQYIWLYLFDVLKADNWEANLLGIGIPVMVMMPAYPVWGRLIDRLGKRPILVICTAGFSLSPLGWIVMAADGWWPTIGYAVILLSVFAYPGVELAQFNVLLDASGTRSRDGGGSAYATVAFLVFAVGGAVSGLLGGGVAHEMPNFHWPIPGLHADLTYHGLLLLGCGVMRLLAAGWAISLQEPRATGTRMALGYMTNSVYSNVRQAAVWPVQILGRALVGSYRIGRRPKRP